MGKVREYLKLMRFQAAGAVWIVLVIGALAQTGTKTTWELLFQLFPLGALTYVLAIVMNEYYDVEVDRASKALSTKPLVSGEISMRSALVICWIALILSSIYVVVLWGPIVLLWYLLSSLVGAQYNIHGKKHYGMDFFVSLWAAMYCILGAMIAGPVDTMPWKLEPLVYVMSWMWFFRLVVGNSVEGGLKDLEHDLAYGAKTLPRLFGVKLEKDRIRYTPGWLVFQWGLEICFAAAIITPAYYGQISISLVQSIVITGLLAGMVLTLMGIAPRKFHRERMKKNIYIHEAMGFGIMGIMLLEKADWGHVLVILFFPIIWFAIWTRAIYGKSLPTI